MLCGIATYGQILDQLVLEIVLFRLDPGLLVALEEQVHGSVPGKQRIRASQIIQESLRDPAEQKIFTWAGCKAAPS